MSPLRLAPSVICALWTAVGIAAPSVSLDLGGTWQTINLDRPAFPPADAEGWYEVDVIAPVGARPGLCQRRAFTIPPEFAGQRLFLRFEGVKYTATVRCNGAEVGGHMGGYEPFECEITHVARVGAENVVEVLVGSRHELCADPEALRGLTSARDDIESLGDHVLYPVGSHDTMGIWAPVSLEARPEVYVEDVYIVPSFREKTLTVETTVRNLSAQSARFAVRGDVLRGDDRLLSIPPIAGEVAGQQATVVRAVTPWADPPLWWPDDPVLLHLQADLEIDGRLADRRTERFGFREFWAEGPTFVLNGIPLHLRANSCHPLGYTREVAAQTYDILREGNINAFRLHAQPWGKAWYDVADETGMLIQHETAVWCLARAYALADERFWSNFAEHIRAQIRLHRNRPSVISWSLENEMLHVGGSRVPETEQRLADLATVAREVDASRLIYYSGDEDPMGAADVIGLHYPHNFPRNRLWPNSCWWLNTPKVVEGWPRREWLWSREKPLFIGEYLWQPSSTPDPYSLFYGDEAYTDLTRHRYLAKALSWRFQIEAHRAEGLSGGCPWNIFEGGRPIADSPMYQATSLAYRPQAALIREWDSVFFPGQTITRSVTFINDVLRPARLTASWFCLMDGRESSRGGVELDMQPAQIIPRTVELTAPGAPQEAAFEIVFTLAEDGEEVFRETRLCSVVPPEPLPGADWSRVALYDPSGDTAARLRDLGAEPQVAASLQDLPEGVACLVIGENAFAPPEGADAPVIGLEEMPGDVVQAFAQAGGHVIVLAQQHLPEWLPARLLENGSTFAFVRRPQHPLVAGGAPEDFQLWGPDHIVSRRDMARPERGSAQVIVDAGGAGLDRALLMEVPAGRGSYVLCQLPLVERLGAAPVARRTLMRLLDHALRGPQEPPRALIVLSENPRLAASLRAMGVRVVESTDHPDAAWALVDGDLPAGLQLRDEMFAFVERGGFVWLHGPSEEYLEALGLSSDAVTWTRTGTAPIRALPASGLGEGLRTEDLYWLADTRPRRHANWALTPEVANHVLRPRLAAQEAVSIPADDFDNSEVRITRRAPEGIWISTSDSITATVDIPAAGAYVIGVLAGGTPLGDIFPAYSVTVGDVPVGGFMATGREPSLHTVSGTLPAGRHVLRITFTNDAHDPPEDRNALVAGASIAPALPLPDDITPLTEPAALYTIRRGAGSFLVDGINWSDPGQNAPRAIRLISTLLGNAGVDMPIVARGLTVPFTGFSLDPDAIHVRIDGQGLYLGDTAWAEGPVTFARGGRYALILEARGTEALGEFPEIEFSVDGEVIGAQHLQAPGWQDVVFVADVTQGERTLRIRFTNDYYDPALHLDRNLWVRRLAIAPEK